MVVKNLKVCIGLQRSPLVLRTRGSSPSTIRSSATTRVRMGTVCGPSPLIILNPKSYDLKKLKRGNNMTYDKGNQITVGDLRRYLSFIPDDVKISICLGDKSESLHYLSKEGNELVLSHDIYMVNALEYNLETSIKFSRMKQVQL